MLANDLAKAIADLWAAVISISWLGRQFLRFPRRRSRFGKRSDLLDRADTDAIGLPQCTVDGARLSDPHFGAPEAKRRHWTGRHLRNRRNLCSEVICRP